MCINWGMDKQNMVCIYLYSENIIHQYKEMKYWYTPSHWVNLENIMLSEKSVVKVAQSCLILCDPMDYSPPSSSVHGDSPDKDTIHGNPGDLPNPGIKPRSPTLQVDFLPTEPPVKEARHKGNALMIYDLHECPDQQIGRERKRINGCQGPGAWGENRKWSLIC